MQSLFLSLGKPQKKAVVCFTGHQLRQRKRRRNQTRCHLREKSGQMSVGTEQKWGYVVHSGAPTADRMLADSFSFCEIQIKN